MSTEKEIKKAKEALSLIKEIKEASKPQKEVKHKRKKMHRTSKKRSIKKLVNEFLTLEIGNIERMTFPPYSYANKDENLTEEFVITASDEFTVIPIKFASFEQLVNYANKCNEQLQYIQLILEAQGVELDSLGGDEEEVQE